MASNSKSKNKNEQEPQAMNKYSLENIKNFSTEVKVEFDKIAWPDKKHTMGSTLVVVVLVMMVSFYLGAVDLVLGKIIGTVLK
nr:preprotein translocase subunit SecE [Desulfobulbaceae bacterium]